MTLVQYPTRKVFGVSDIVDAIVDLIKKGIIAKTNVTSDVSIGGTVVPIQNAFQFRADDEIVLIDYGYNQEGHDHYQQFEYAKIKEVNNTNAITLHDPLEGNWSVSDSAFVQKTVGHSPLYDDYVYYGDRAVIPMDQMAVTVEPVSLSNEWMYIQGGLNQEYRLQITIYGKDANMDTGKRIVDMYTDQIYQLLNDNMHMDIDGYEAPLISDALAGDTEILVEDTPENRENFAPGAALYADDAWGLQDNTRRSCCCIDVESISYGGGILRIRLTQPLTEDFLISEFAVFRRNGRYIWDSRASGVTYGTIQKQSGLLRAGQIDWYCKWVNEHEFPQTSKRTDNFDPIQPNESSSSSSLDSSSSL